MEKLLLLGVLLVAASRAQVIFRGSCPSVKLLNNFKPKNYLGEWFEYKRYFELSQVGGTCITAKYTDKGNGVIGVVNRQYSNVLRRYMTVVATASQVGTSGKLVIRFPLTGNLIGANHFVLGTDYTSYAVVWSCTNMALGLTNLQHAWVLTRDRSPSSTVVASADQVLKDNAINLNVFRLTPQSNCPA